MKPIAKLQYISRDNEPYTHAQQAKLLFENGITWVQLRMKNLQPNQMQEQAEEALEYAHRWKATLLINDKVELAKTVGAHGVHLGLKDMSIKEARKILGSKAIIGGTANTLEDIQHQIAEGADYVGLGPFRFTTTKENLSPVIGLEGYRNIMQQLQELNITTPLIAVGGITDADMAAILQTGMHGVAVSGALFDKLMRRGK